MKDLTNLKTYIIDSDSPHEIDDAISLERTKDNKKKFGYILVIHAVYFPQDRLLTRRLKRKVVAYI